MNVAEVGEMWQLLEQGQIEGASLDQGPGLPDVDGLAPVASLQRHRAAKEVLLKTYRQSWALAVIQTHLYDEKLLLFAFSVKSS